MRRVPPASDPWGASPVPEAPPVPPVDYSGKRRELESALKGFGFKGAEIKVAIASVDLTLPVEDLIAQILRGQGK
jgi:hypothetical protein